MDTRSLGHIAYDAYKDSNGGKSAVTGADLPSFGETNEAVQKGWEAAAYAVRSHLIGDPVERRSPDQDTALEKAFVDAKLPEEDRRESAES